MTQLKCLRCESAMAPGWLVENITFGSKYNRTVVEPTLWVSGDAEPIKDQWGSAEGVGFDVQEREILQTFSYRCTGCGLLEIYARPIEEPYVRP